MKEAAPAIAGDEDEDEDLDDAFGAVCSSRAVAAPPLLGCLAGDAEPEADVGPAVAALGASPVMASRMAASSVVGERGHVVMRVDVAGGDAAAVGADDAAERRPRSRSSPRPARRCGVKS